MNIIRTLVALSIIAAMSCVCWRMVSDPWSETIIFRQPRYEQPTEMTGTI